jgi:hypothetical protein
MEVSACFNRLSNSNIKSVKKKDKKKKNKKNENMYCVLLWISYLSSMATRSNIHFTQGERIIANIYVHYDGYPENRLPELQQFFKEVKERLRDTRFTDPSYLAAKYIVWYTHILTNQKMPSLDFLGIGIAVEDAGDAEFIYKVDCKNHDENGFPVVTYKKA